MLGPFLRFEGILNPALLWFLKADFFLPDPLEVGKKKSMIFCRKKKSQGFENVHPKKLHGKEKGLPSQPPFCRGKSTHPAVQGRPCMA